jgi:hypothetical protein
MPALPESVRQAAELSNQLQAKAKAGTLTIEDFQPTNKLQVTPTAQVAPAQPSTATGPGTPGFTPQAAATPPAPPLRLPRKIPPLSSGSRSCRASTTPRCRACTRRSKPLSRK